MRSKTVFGSDRSEVVSELLASRAHHLTVDLRITPGFTCGLVAALFARRSDRKVSGSGAARGITGLPFGGIDLQVAFKLRDDV